MDHNASIANCITAGPTGGERRPLRQTGRGAYTAGRVPDDGRNRGAEPAEGMPGSRTLDPGWSANAGTRPGIFRRRGLIALGSLLPGGLPFSRARRRKPPARPLRVRRIVTHNDGQGLSYALMDGPAANVPGTLTGLWTTGSNPADFRFTADGARPRKTWSRRRTERSSGFPRSRRARNQPAFRPKRSARRGPTDFAC